MEQSCKHETSNFWTHCLLTLLSLYIFELRKSKTGHDVKISLK